MPKTRRIKRRNSAPDIWPEQKVPLYTENMPTSDFFSHSALCMNHTLALSRCLSGDFSPLLNYLPKSSTFSAAECPADSLMWLAEQSVAVDLLSARERVLQFEPSTEPWVDRRFKQRQWWEFKAEGGSWPSQLHTNQSLKWIPEQRKPETTRDTADLHSTLLAGGKQHLS